MYLDVKLKGSAATSASVSMPGGITAWGGPLLAALAQAVGVPWVAEVWIRYGEDDTEDLLDGGKKSWRVIRDLDPDDTVLVVGSAIPLSRAETLTLQDTAATPDAQDAAAAAAATAPLAEPAVSDQPAQHTRPPGRPPKHSRWDPVAACWVKRHCFGSQPSGPGRPSKQRRINGRFVASGGADRTQSAAACSPNAVGEDDGGGGNRDGDESPASSSALPNEAPSRDGTHDGTAAMSHTGFSNGGADSDASVQETAMATVLPDALPDVLPDVLPDKDESYNDSGAPSPAAAGPTTRKQRLRAADLTPWTKMRNPRTPHTAVNPPHYYWNEPTGLVAWDDPGNPRYATGKLKTTPTLVTATMQPTASCSLCAMVFYDLDAPDAVDLHMAAKHACTDCGKTGVDVAKCKSRHSSQRRLAKELAGPGVDCAVCAKHFQLKRRLQIHMRVHTGERPFACTDCPKRFANQYNYSVHRRVHTGDRPFPCPLPHCSRGFTTKQAAAMHAAAKSHPPGPGDDIPAAPTINNGLIMTV